MPDFEKIVWDIFEKHNIGKHEDEGCVPAADEIAQIMSNLRIELCLKCEKYKNAHNGACDWCKWK
jgi:hypothetical protein